LIPDRVTNVVTMLTLRLVAGTAPQVEVLGHRNARVSELVGDHPGTAAALVKQRRDGSRSVWALTHCHRVPAARAWDIGRRIDIVTMG
jgi:hypothetical protein